MKTIKRNEEIAFNALTLKDAVVLLPLMDALVDAVNKNKLAEFYNNLTQEEREQYRKEWGHCDIHLTAETIERTHALLSSLGFESQIDIKEPTLKDLKKKN